MRLVGLLVFVPVLALAAPGDLDPGFGTGGTSVSTAVVSAVGGLGLQPDGRLVVAAVAPAPDGTWELVLVRFGTDGAPDPAFGAAAMVIEPAGIYFRPALLVEPDGSLVVAAARCTGARCDGTIRRYDPDGRPDPSFTPIDRFVDSPTYAEVVVRQDDDKLVFGGNAGHAPAFVVWLARAAAVGTEDRSFGTNGLVDQYVSSHGASLGSLVLEPGSALVAAVTAATTEGIFSSLVRFDASGARDAGAPCPFGYPRLAVDALGHVVAAGTFQSSANPTPRLGVARFEADLTADATFGGGSAITGPPGSAGDVLIEPDASIVVAAALGDPDASRFALLRWTADGTVDPAFGRDGIALAFADRTGGAQRVLRQPDGKLVAAGVLGSGGGGRLILARFLDTEAVSTSTTTTTTPDIATRCTVDGMCDDGSCSDDRCDAGPCVHEPLASPGPFACVCAPPLPICDEGGPTRIGSRLARACRLVAHADAARPARARRLRRRALHLLRLDRRAMLRIAKTRPSGSTCAAEILRRLDAALERL